MVSRARRAIAWGPTRFKISERRRSVAKRRPAPRAQVKPMRRPWDFKPRPMRPMPPRSAAGRGPIPRIQPRSATEPQRPVQIRLHLAPARSLPPPTPCRSALREPSVASPMLPRESTRPMPSMSASSPASRAASRADRQPAEPGHRQSARSARRHRVGNGCGSPAIRSTARQAVGGGGLWKLQGIVRPRLRHRLRRKRPLAGQCHLLGIAGSERLRRRRIQFVYAELEQREGQIGIWQ